ncbi:UNVERIFIED_CONTAM: hypothetical protein NCL1_53763 [Trichonephila clavipes]
MEWKTPDGRDHSTLDGGVSIESRLLEEWHESLKGGVNADLLHNHFWTDPVTCSNRLLLFTDISVDGPALSCAVPNVGSQYITVRHFYSKHAAQKYNLDCRKQCLFCFGRKHWPYGQTNRPENVNHVKAGLQRFVEDAKTNEKRRKMRQRGRGGSVWM